MPSRPRRRLAKGGAGGGAQTVLPTRTTTPRVSVSLPVSTVRSWSALVERAQEPASVVLNEETDNGFSAARGVAHRDQAPLGRGLVGIDPEVVFAPSWS